MQARSAPGGGCNLAEAESTLRLEYEDPEQGTEVLWEGFEKSPGPRMTHATRAAAAEAAASCHVRLKLDTAKLDCDDESGWCEGSPYLRLSADRGPEGVAASDVPESGEGGTGAPRFQAAAERWSLLGSTSVIRGLLF